MFEKDQLSVGDWIVYTLLMAIPLVNIILFFMILGNSEANKTLRSFMIAQLVMTVIVVVLYFVFFAALFSELAYLLYI